MNRIQKKFAELRRSKKKALSIFLTAGFPSASMTATLVPELEKAGADFFEIGFPFSDPVADGPVIQRASEASLKAGMTWEKMLGIVRNVRKKSQVPLIWMGYANSLFCRGWERSAKELAQAGFDGVLIPDLTPEENPELPALFKKAGLDLIFFAALTSDEKRLRNAGKMSSGFIYCVSVTGVTGARKELPVREIGRFLGNVKRVSKLPAMLGFGISGADQVRALKGHADGFIVGSAMVRILEENKGGAAVRKAAAFVRTLKQAV